MKLFSLKSSTLPAGVPQHSCHVSRIPRADRDNACGMYPWSRFSCSSSGSFSTSLLPADFAMTLQQERYTIQRMRFTTQWWVAFRVKSVKAAIIKQERLSSQISTHAP